MINGHVPTARLRASPSALPPDRCSVGVGVSSGAPCRFNVVSGRDSRTLGVKSFRSALPCRACVCGTCIY